MISHQKKLRNGPMTLRKDACERKRMHGIPLLPLDDMTPYLKANHNHPVMVGCSVTTNIYLLKMCLICWDCDFSPAGHINIFQWFKSKILMEHPAFCSVALDRLTVVFLAFHRPLQASLHTISCKHSAFASFIFRAWELVCTCHGF